MNQSPGVYRVIVRCAILTAVGAAAAWADRPRVDGPTAIERVALVPAAGQRIDSGTILIRDGRIAAVGADVAVPDGFRRLDGSGLVAYAGFVDALTRAGVVELAADEAEERRWEDEFPAYSDGPLAATVQANRAGIIAREPVQALLKLDADALDRARRNGFAAALLGGPRAVIGAQAAVMQLGDAPPRRSLLVGAWGHTASFQPPAGHALADRGRYPSTTFGVIAHFRQAMNDAVWFREMQRYVAAHPEARAELPNDPDLEALLAVLSGERRLVWEANLEDEIHRALNLAEEFGFKVVIAGGREAYKALERLRQTETPVLVSLKLPPEVREYRLEARRLKKKAEDDSLYGRGWEQRPFEPKRAYEEAKRKRDELVRNVVELERAGVRWAFASYELGSDDTVLESLRELVEAGLSADAAVRGMTSAPAALLGLEAELGAIEPGKRANLTILTRPIGEKDGKVRWVFVDGRQFEFALAETPAARGEGDESAGGRRGGGRRAARTEEQEEEETEEATEEQEREAERRAERRGGRAGRSASSAPASGPAVAGSTPATEPVELGPFADILAHEPGWSIETEADRDPGLRTGGNVLLKNALVLTISGEDLPGTSVLVRDGKIAAIGRDLTAPEGVTALDLTGFVVMPGMIDPHAHIALDSINESSLAVTPEVRCEDVVRHDDADIFRAVAGGTTTIHSMHGSANPIGGQNVVLKLKYGRPASELIVRDRVRTVKFATGENVKRPGMPRQRFGGDGERAPLRFPGSRMGVETTMRRAFYEARKYAERRAEHERAKAAGQDVKPLRRDLRLEALADILEGRIWVHSHCYRADEILRLLSVAEDFGFRVAVLQHVLEGYRIMPEIARHGCGTSTFADWWAYKVEAYYAVPQNAGMLLRHGINSTINSDSSDLMRHLNFEAAKCAKYSGLSANEALRLVTLNGAVQLGLEGRIGSLEVGKDGDIAVFDGHPLDTFSRCVMTFIEGECYFRHRDFDPAGSPKPTRDATAFARAGAGHVAGPGVAMLPAGTNGAELVADGASGGGGQGGVGAGEAGAAGWPPAPNPWNLYAIVGATVHPVSGPPIENGVVIIRDERIDAVGRDIPIPRGATVIDARGRQVWPGLINAATQVGMNEIGQVDVTVDTSETGTYQPDVLAVSGFHPHSAMVGVTRSDGVLSVLLVPGSPTVAGQAGLLNLDGWTTDEMLVEPRVGLVVNLPSRRARPIVEREPRRGRRGAQAPDDDEAPARALKELERFFRDARAYADAVAAAEKGQPAAGVERDPRFDAMIPYVRGEKPVFFRADGYKEILEAVMFAETLGLRPVILGGREAWRAADVLAKRSVPVVYSGVFNVPGESEVWDCHYRALGELARAGVRFCLANGSASLAKLLPLEAGFAVAHGLDPERAVRAMTLDAASILGVADRLGSIESGKRANLIVTTDHPCQATCVVTAAFVAGRPIDLENQHTRFARQFAGRPAPSLPPAPQKLVGPPSRTAQPARVAAGGAP